MRYFSITQREVWDVIADSWTNLRVIPDKVVVDFSRRASGSVLDVGCGNCRNLVPLLKKGLKCVGMDYSKAMIREAKKFLKRRNLSAMLVVGDICFLPFKKGTFQNILCIRTLHHLETRNLRIKALQEMKRVGKRILITVWKKWQTRFLLKLLTSFFSSDIYVDWKYHGRIYKRFYHLYTKRELEKDLITANLKIEKIWEDKIGNICSLIR